MDILVAQRIRQTILKNFPVREQDSPTKITYPSRTTKLSLKVVRLNTRLKSQCLFAKIKAKQEMKVMIRSHSPFNFPT